MAILFGLHFLTSQMGGCSPSDNRFNQAIVNSGLEDSTRKGYDYFECGYGDVWVEGFTAKRPNLGTDPVTRSTVTGTVCCGILKGCTVRWP